MVSMCSMIYERYSIPHPIQKDYDLTIKFDSNIDIKMSQLKRNCYYGQKISNILIYLIELNFT